jgi:hypothetical protein
MAYIPAVVPPTFDADLVPPFDAGLAPKFEAELPSMFDPDRVPMFDAELAPVPADWFAFAGALLRNRTAAKPSNTAAPKKAVGCRRAKS